MKLRILVPTLLLPFTFPAIAQNYKVTILPKLNGLNADGFSMNASAQVVGDAPVPGGGSRNFLWSRQGDMVDITSPTQFSIKNLNAGGFIAVTVTSVQGPPPDGENIVIKDGTKILGTVALSSGTASFSTSS